MELKDRVAIVTGAGSGIGRAIAIEFATHGARVVCSGRRLDRLQADSELGRKWIPSTADCLAQGQTRPPED